MRPLSMFLVSLLGGFIGAEIVATLNGRSALLIDGLLVFGFINLLFMIIHLFIMDKQIKHIKVVKDNE